MKTTAGIFLMNSQEEILVVHPTNSPFTKWSIPKGLVDGTESIREAAVRELEEETGFVLAGQKILYESFLGHKVYQNKKKVLAPLFIWLKGDFHDYPFKCVSMVKHHRGDYPEVDMFKWVNLWSAADLVHPTQVECISAIMHTLRTLKIQS